MTGPKSPVAGGIKEAGCRVEGADASAKFVAGDMAGHDRIIYRFAIRGAKDKADKQAGAAETNAGRSQRRTEWQEAADGVWLRHPGWSKRAVAIQIAKNTGDNADTIRRAITCHALVTDKD